jgi:hypothetical protein
MVEAQKVRRDHNGGFSAGSYLNETDVAEVRYRYLRMGS